MSDLIQAVLDSDEKTNLRQFSSLLRGSEKRYLLRNEILTVFTDYCKNYEKSEQFCTTSRLSKLVSYLQEAIIDDTSLCLIVRPRIASQEAYRLLEDMTVEPMSLEDLLDLRDRLVNRYHPHEGDVFEIDFQPFYDYSPTIRDAKNIGKGVEFLNRYLSSKLFQDQAQWQEASFHFLRLHRYNGYQLLINDRIQTRYQLSDRVKAALNLLSDRSEDELTKRFDLRCKIWVLSQVGAIRHSGCAKRWECWIS